MKIASLTALFLSSFPLVFSAAPGVDPQREDDHPSWTSPKAKRYPWPMGTYIRDKAYFNSVRETCDAARTAGEVPAVDCWYTWENRKGDNHLLYSVSVAPPSNPAVKWYNLCHGIYDNVKQQCGRSADCNNVNPGCWCDREIAAGPGLHHGVRFFFPTRHWASGEDNMACVGAAVQEALCGIEPSFRKGRCYKMLGSQLHPDD